MHNILPVYSFVQICTDHSLKAGYLWWINFDWFLFSSPCSCEAKARVVFEVCVSHSLSLSLLKNMQSDRAAPVNMPVFLVIFLHQSKKKRVQLKCNIFPKIFLHRNAFQMDHNGYVIRSSWPGQKSLTCIARIPALNYSNRITINAIRWMMN